MPTTFIPHGGGPWPVMPMGALPQDERERLLAYMGSIAGLPHEPPKALLVVSAHWEAAVPTVNAAPTPDLYFDYYNFPEEAYTYRWPAPGAPALGGRVRELLGAAGFQTAEERDRGFDHGVFVPMMVAYPEAQVPCLQLSMLESLDPREHLAMGRALAPLRDEGVLVIGSGNSFHNLRALMGRGPALQDASLEFDAWLSDVVQGPVSERNDRLAAWAEAPRAKDVHPREEHLLPLMVAAGAAEGEVGEVVWTGTMAGCTVSAHAFGG